MVANMDEVLRTTEKPELIRIDLSRLLEAAAGDEVQFKRLCELFLSTSSQLFAQIRDGVTQGNSELLGRASHSLKGSAYVVGADRLAGMLQSVESHARAGTVGMPTAQILAALAEELGWVAHEVSLALKP